MHVNVMINVSAIEIINKYNVHILRLLFAM